MNTRILLAEDFEILRDSLMALLRDIPGISVVGAVENGNDVISFLETAEVDIVLLDIEMPEMDGIEAARIIKNKFKKVKIIMLSMYNSYDYVKPLFELGIDGYLLKNTSKKELLQAISIVTQGGNYYTPITKQVYEEGNKQKSRTMSTLEAYNLSDREVQIIILITDGVSTEDMSKQLSLSVHTISTHRKNVYRKTGLSSPVELTKFALEVGLIEGS